MVKNYEEFMEEAKEMLKKEFSEKLPEKLQGKEVIFSKVTKVNNKTLDAYTLSCSDSPMPTMYIQDIYEDVCKGRTLEAAVSEAVDAYIKALDNVKDIGDIQTFVTRIKDPEYVKANVIFNLVNADNNKDYLKNKPFRSFKNLDLAVTYVLLHGDYAKITISEDLMTSLGLTEEILFNSAYLNTKGTYLVRDMNEVIVELKPENMELDMSELDMSELDGPTMFVISNKETRQGASAILHDEVLAIAGEKMGSDYYIIPSSIYEILAIPADSMPLAEIAHMVGCVNDNAVSPDEVLSYNVYFYDTEKHEVSVAVHQ